MMSKEEYLKELKTNLEKKGMATTYEYVFEYETKYNNLKRKNISDEQIYLELGFPRQVAQEILDNVNNKVGQEEIIQEKHENSKKAKSPLLNTLVMITNGILAIITFILRLVMATYGVLGLIFILIMYSILSFSVDINFFIYTFIIYLLILLLIHSIIRILMLFRKLLKKSMSSKYIEVNWLVPLIYFVVILLLFFIAWAFYSVYFAQTIQIALDQGSDKVASIPIIGPLLQQNNIIQ